MSPSRRRSACCSRRATSTTPATCPRTRSRRVAGNADIAVDSGDKGYILYLGLNQKNADLAKPEVREALKWLVDYDAIEKNIVAGTYRAAPIASCRPASSARSTTSPTSSTSPRRKELLAKAGLPNGFTVTMDVRSTSPITDIAQAIQATWAQAGIKLDLIPGDGRQTLTKYRARTHDIYIGQWGPDYQDPHTNADTFAINPDNADDAKSKTLAWRNAWDIPEMTKQTIGRCVLERDAEKRAAGYETSQREHQKVSPFVIMFQQIEVAARRKNVDGFVIGPTSDTNYYAGSPRTDAAGRSCRSAHVRHGGRGSPRPPHRAIRASARRELAHRRSRPFSACCSSPS